VICSIRDVQPLNQLDAVRILLSLVMLGYTSWVDIKTREIYELIWLVFGGMGLVLALYEVYVSSLALTGFVTTIVFSVVISVVLGYLGLFGGADVEAFIALSILHPIPPRGLEPMLGVVSVIYPLTLFSNAALSGASFALVLLGRNSLKKASGEALFVGLGETSSIKKLIVMVSGAKIKIDSVRGPPFQYPLENLDENFERRLILMPDIQDDDAAVEVFRRLREAGVEEVWVSNTLPFLVFISIGYVIALILGDIALFALGRYLLGWF
jgi:preflagellin peptidase FlaK